MTKVSFETEGQTRWHGMTNGKREGACEGEGEGEADRGPSGPFFGLLRMLRRAPDGVESTTRRT